MTVNELKAKVADYHKTLESKQRAPVIMGPTGPVGISLIDDVVSTIEDLQRQIDELNRAPARMG